MRPRPARNYEDDLFRFMKREEGFRANVYACSRHVPTIGVGYALAEKTKSGFQQRAWLDEDLARIGTSLTKSDKDRLLKICDMLNDGSITQAITDSKFHDPFDLHITEEQAKQLFQLCVPRYDSVIKKRIGLKLYKELKNTHEMVTLFSLAYNAPSLIGKNLINALNNGNRSEIQYEIRYNSNRNRDVGLDARRKRETDQIGRYDGVAPTLEELRAEEETKREHAVQTAGYDGDMNGKRKSGSAKRATGPKKVVANRRKRPQPGSVPNQKEVRMRLDDVKAHPVHQERSMLDKIIELFGGYDKVIHRDWNDHPADHDAPHYHKRWS